MKINTSKIDFLRPLTKRKSTKSIVVHHSASGINITVQDINRWHLNNGWSGIGYHYVIYADGQIWTGRPEDTVGAHAYYSAKQEANSNGIGICLIGNFETGKPTSQQLDSLVWLIRDIRTRYPGIAVKGHKDVMPTACPGRNFPWAELCKRLTEEVLDVALEKWMIEGGREALAYLEKQKLVFNAADWGEEKKLGAATPQYLFWMLMQRVVERMEGKK